jgi:hypothetical protein
MSIEHALTELGPATVEAIHAEIGRAVPLSHVEARIRALVDAGHASSRCTLWGGDRRSRRLRADRRFPRSSSCQGRARTFRGCEQSD